MTQRVESNRRSAPATGCPLTAVIAMTPGGVIGRQGGLPWRLSSDLKRFKALTWGGTLIMGRKTYESIGRPLPGRDTIVITGNPHWRADGVRIAFSPERSLQMIERPPAFLVGGAEIYRQLLPRCDQIYLTRVLAEVAGDTLLELNEADFEVLERTPLPASPRDDHATEFIRLVRRPGNEKNR